MRIRLILVWLLLMVCANLFAGNAASGDVKIPKGFIKLDNRIAPHFSLLDIDGVRFKYDNTGDKWRFIHFWASWCGPCRKEIPELEKLGKSAIAKQLDIFIINTGEDEDTIFRFMAEYAPELHTLMDLDGSVTEKYSPRGLPTTYLVNPQGEMIYLALGGVHWTEPAYTNFLQSLVSDH